MSGSRNWPLVADFKEPVYAAAYLFYQNRQYVEAAALFRLLAQSNPLEADYWKGLGASLQMQSAYQEALECYYRCADCLSGDEAIDPMLYVHVSDCLFGLNEVERALRSLEKGASFANGGERIRQHLIFMKGIWKKNDTDSK